MNTNIQLVIKRAENYQNEKFIRERLAVVGKIERLDFTKKTDHVTKKDYSTVIVTFTKWNSTEIPMKIQTELLPPGAQYKFSFKDLYNQDRYWHLQKHQPARTDTPPPEPVPFSEREIDEIKIENHLLREKMKQMEEKMLMMEERMRNDYSAHCAIRDDADDLHMKMDVLQKKNQALQEENKNLQEENRDLLNINSYYVCDNISLGHKLDAAIAECY